ncbi:MAG: DsrE family protein [Chloroflexota bacterium]
MARLLFHITTGPENPTKATLGLLIARTAVEEGHAVDVFFAGDGVDYIRPETRDVASGIGIGNAGEHYQALVDHGATLWGSGMSAKVRGVESDGSAQLAPPKQLVALMAAADNVITY